MTAVQTGSNPASVRGLERWAWLPPALYVVALLGIPVAVVFATGGPTTIGFWFEALFHLIVAFTLGAAMFALVGFLIAAPIGWIHRRVAPARNDDLTTYATGVLMVFGGTVYFLTEPSLNNFYVRLPTDTLNLGAFLVLVGAGLAGWALLYAAGRVHRAIGTRRAGEILTPSRSLTRGARPWGASPPEPDAVFWSPNAIVAWRSWAWTGKTLHGYRIKWPAAVLAADCDECGIAPGWDHACGIYATKELADVEMFGQVPVVGRVEMWGEIIEHDFGYRSSHARITDLWVDSPTHARRIGRAYPGVRVWEALPAEVQEVAYGRNR